MKTKRSLFIIAIIFCMQLSLRAQAPEQGTIRYLCTSNWAKMIASVDYISKLQRDRMMYMWGNHSEWKNYMLLHFSPGVYKYEESEELAEADMAGWSNRKETFFMKRDFNNNITFDGITLQGKTYLVEDTIAPPAWKILNDMKEVAGHICMNATFTDTLRKQTVIAWFALDMPGRGGPDRFVGLPGMILEVDINDGAYTMVADKIDTKTLTNELDLPKKLKGKKINNTGYLQIFEKKIAESKAAEEPWFWGIKY